MRFLGIFFYATVVILIGVMLIIFALNRLSPQDITEILIILQDSLSSRLIIGLSGILLILLSFSVAQLILGRFQREKTIAFTTASGEVTIALSAVEDLIRKLSGVIPEIKELRPNVIATKKGIMVYIRVALRSAANIPEITSRLQEIARSKRHSHQFSLIFLDVDHFKKFNDSYGHLNGDKVLTVIAQILLETVRVSDIVARYGGEEFVLILPETDPEGAGKVAEKLRASVEKHPIELGKEETLGKVTVSLGVSTFPDNGQDGTILIEHADRALYKAKESGRNCVV